MTLKELGIGQSARILTVGGEGRTAPAFPGYGSNPKS